MNFFAVSFYSEKEYKFMAKFFLPGFIPTMKINPTALLPQQTIQKLIKPHWTTSHAFENDTRKIFEPIEFHNPLIGKLFMDIKENNEGFCRMVIQIKNRLNKLLGSEIISIDKDTKNIEGLRITVEPEYRRKSYKFGELLRLGSIMEMIENKSEYINIFSVNDAVYFHSKYKFEPQIKAFDERNNVLETIMSEKRETLKDIKAQAEKIVSAIEKNRHIAELQRKYCQQTSALAKDYIERVQKEDPHGKIHPFKYGISMSLKMETVLENKNFFNELFKKHGIDYKI